MGGGSWKVAYADFVTAMMAFFLLMWILNMTPPETKQVLSQYFTADYKITDSETNSPPVPGVGVAAVSSMKTAGNKEDAQTFEAISIELQRALLLSEDTQPVASNGISKSDMGVLLRVAGDVMFNPNSVVFTPGGVKILDEVVNIMRNRQVFVVVRGHADSTETGLPYFPSRWELSAARSTVAVRYMVERGVDPAHVRSVAYADTAPLVPSNIDNSSGKNRRIEFYFHKPDDLSLTLGY